MECFIQSEETSICPVCSVPLVVIGSRERKMITGDEAVRTLVIRRLRCSRCQRIHHELPDIIIPYKRHSAETIERIIAEEYEEVNCEESTIRRIKAWWAASLMYFESVIASLREKYGAMLSLCPAPREIVRAVVNANLWVHTRSAFLSG